MIFILLKLCWFGMELSEQQQQIHKIMNIIIIIIIKCYRYLFDILNVFELKGIFKIYGIWVNKKMAQ